jgi:ribosomal protein L11 methyltransferase
MGQARSLLDIGTGSGILAIAAAKLGYHPVHAFDTDPAAVRVAKANALRNRVEKRLRIFRQDLTRLPLQGIVKFDVVCANLICELLISQSKRILNRLQPNGTLILAGILKTQLAPVRQVYAAAGLKMIATRTENEWRSGAFAFRH